jgi:hypothetical protein
MQQQQRDGGNELFQAWLAPLHAATVKWDTLAIRRICTKRFHAKNKAIWFGSDSGRLMHSTAVALQLYKQDILLDAERYEANLCLLEYFVLLWTLNFYFGKACLHYLSNYAEHVQHFGIAHYSEEHA